MYSRTGYSQYRPPNSSARKCWSLQILAAASLSICFKWRPGKHKDSDPCHFFIPRERRVTICWLLVAHLIRRNNLNTGSRSRAPSSTVSNFFSKPCPKTEIWFRCFGLRLWRVRVVQGGPKLFRNEVPARTTKKKSS